MPHLSNRRAGRETPFQSRSELFVQPRWSRDAARLVAGLAPCLFLLVAPGCGSEDASAKRAEGWGKKPATVEVTRIQPELLRDTVVLSGSLAAESEVLLLSEIDGVVASVDFREGTPVTQGEVLFRLHDEEQTARLMEARAELQLAQDIFERTQRLINRDVSSMARRQEATAKRDQALARVALAELQLRRTRIRAPFDGVTGQRHVSVGDRVDEKVGMVSVADIDPLQLMFSVTEAAASLARTGIHIEAHVVAWPGEYFPGEIFFVSPTIDPVSRRLLLKAWVPNAEGKLKPGMFANVDVVISVREDALMVPESALVYDRNGTYLWRVDSENRAEKIPIEIGLRQAGRVEILKGVSIGDRIVSAGTNKLSAGSEIIAVEPHPGALGDRPSPASPGAAGSAGSASSTDSASSTGSTPSTGRNGET